MKINNCYKKNMRVVVALGVLISVFLSTSVHGDVYLHNPRGSNNRNCENDENRNNNNRLFDSQNNNKGGYACPRATPFKCYLKDGNDQNECNNKNENLQNDQQRKDAVSDVPPNNLLTVGPNGQLARNDEDYVPMERMYYVKDSVLPIEWTAQHACGANSKVHCDIVIQVACEDQGPSLNPNSQEYPKLNNERAWTTLTDDCGSAARKWSERCQPRDGTPINNDNNDQLNGKATADIRDQTQDQDDYRRGRQETYQFYQNCKYTSRNQGLFVADQDLNGQDARFTRQNPNGGKSGLECPEERDYYPYWRATPWKDIAILTSDLSKCSNIAKESQNVKAKSYCDCSATADGKCNAQANANGRKIPITKEECEVAQNGRTAGVWTTIPAFNLPPPDCVQGPWSRDNHLGNGPSGYATSYNWTVPSWLEGYTSCALRVRYNISTGDANDVSVLGNNTLNGDNSPIIDRNEREEESYQPVLGSKLGFATNTNQHGRVFQDRSYMFSVKPRNERTAGKCAEDGDIYNLNVRGKRGNIVQVYPAVEYDFVPNKMVISEDDCVHVQWAGTDYGQDRQPNNAEGGPSDPNNDNQARADRTNLVPMVSETNNIPSLDTYPKNWVAGDDKSSWKMFDIDESKWKELVHINQDIDNPDRCNSFQALQNRNPNDRQARERDPRNCMKLSGAESPYFNAGVLKAGNRGKYQFMSSRNNNFSNRGQKGFIIIGESSASKTAKIIGITFGVGLLVVAAFFGYRHFSAGDMSKRSSFRMSRGFDNPVDGGLKNVVTIGGGQTNGGGSRAQALYDHEAKEPGELNFKKGQFITVTEKDKSGWWTGSTDDGQTGVFPANYVKA